MWINANLQQSSGLDHDANVRKMRLLTFIQMAENQTEMTFDTLMQELQLNVDDVEGFIIEGKHDYLIFSNTFRKTLHF